MSIVDPKTVSDDDMYYIAYKLLLSVFSMILTYVHSCSLPHEPHDFMIRIMYVTYMICLANKIHKPQDEPKWGVLPVLSIMPVALRRYDFPRWSILLISGGDIYIYTYIDILLSTIIINVVVYYYHDYYDHCYPIKISPNLLSPV